MCPREWEGDPAMLDGINYGGLAGVFPLRA
jgi:hypothetical protein